MPRLRPWRVGCEASRVAMMLGGVGAVGESHHGAQDHQRSEAGDGPLALTRTEKASIAAMMTARGPTRSARRHEQRRDAPGDGEDTGDQAEVAIAEVEFLHDRWKHRQDHEAVEADEAEPQRQEGDGLPFIGGVPPELRFSRAWSGSFFCGVGATSGSAARWSGAGRRRRQASASGGFGLPDAGGGEGAAGGTGRGATRGVRLSPGRGRPT